MTTSTDTTTTDTSTSTGTGPTGAATTPAPSIDSVTFDCADALGVATFWSAVLRRPLGDGASAAWATLPGSPSLTFNQVPDERTVKNRVHLDLAASDRPGEVERLLALGASVVEEHRDGDVAWTTMRDVEGNEFCVS
jgi:hypothetical protein